MSNIPYHEHTFVIPTATTEEIAAGIVSDKAVTPDQLLPVLESLDFSEAMPKLIYDPNNVAGDVFDMDNMVEGATNLILTAAERALIASAVQTGDALVAADIGTTVQAWDAQLDSLSSASANGVSLVTAADYAAMRALLDLEAGTDFYSKTAADAAFQPLDADLTALAALSSTAGMVSRTGAGAFAVRTLTAPAAGISISNGTGAAGNPTLALADDLAALEGLSGTGVAERTGTSSWVLRAKPFASMYDFAGVGDGVADDTTPTNSLQSAGGGFVPTGTFKTSIADTSLTGPFWGNGQVQDNSGNRRGKIFNAISSRPSLGSYGSVSTFFNGDNSKVPFAVEHRITGSATLGQPTSGYVYTPEASPFAVYLYNSSGYNNSTSDNTGRTAAVAFRTVMAQVGQGDCMAYNFSVFVNGARSGATGFLANPAGSGLAGEVIAGHNGVYLNPMEINCNGDTYDVAGVGAVFNLTRNDATAALGEIWNGVRVQSLGSAAADSAFMCTGSLRTGLDLVHATFDSNKAAIAIKADDRIYLNATADSRSVKSKPAFNNNYFYYSSSLSAAVFVIGGSAIFQVYSNQIVAAGAPFNASSTHYRVDSTQVVGSRKTGWTADTGTAKRTANATYSATAAGSYNQTDTQTLMNEVRDLSQTIKALKDDLISHGLIGT